MTKQEKYEYWLDTATYDLETAENMLKGNRYVYVAFMCQQAIEKIIKGLYCYHFDDNIPRVHNISYLFNKLNSQIKIQPDESYYELFDRLTACYIHGRYPTYKEKISETINQNEAKEILTKTKEVFKWLKSLKK